MKRPTSPRSLLTLDINILINFHQTYILLKVSSFNLHFDYFVFITFIHFLNCAPNIGFVWFQHFGNY